MFDEVVTRHEELLDCFGDFFAYTVTVSESDTPAVIEEESGVVLDRGLTDGPHLRFPVI
ncbi:hypothetical protein [Streptosporangium saharense]|uniref:hypothetical protein n=1 Tax=Streptosporangium saharense TaxID=1706840 RepID=UPI00332F03A6